eukprot:1159941-Pelagomonas_calceolata.AAC.2
MSLHGDIAYLRLTLIPNGTGDAQEEPAGKDRKGRRGGRARVRSTSRGSSGNGRGSKSWGSRGSKSRGSRGALGASCSKTGSFQRCE